MALASLLAPRLNPGADGGSAEVPGALDLSIGGHGYKADTSFEPYRREALRQKTIEALRSATDITNQPGEGTINTQGLWRREAQDWSDGAGQQFGDRRQSSPARFRTSQGIDPWTKWQLTLQHDTGLLKAFTDTDIQVMTVGNYVFMRTSTELWTATVTSTGYIVNTTITGLPGTLTDMTHNGHDIWIACGTSGVYHMTVGSPSAASLLTGNLTNIAFVLGSLMGSYENILYYLASDTDAIGTGDNVALLTMTDSNFAWDEFCGGSGWIYIAGHSNNYAAIYRTQLKTDGVTMNIPVVSAPLPHGEIVTDLYGYTNFILVGTNLGTRFCETLSINDPGGNSGDLKLGPIIPDLVQPVTNPVRCHVGNGRYIFFGLSKFSTESVPAVRKGDPPSLIQYTGLARMDISNFTDALAPAYASDLMAAVTVAGAGDIHAIGQPILVPGIGIVTPPTVGAGTGVVSDPVEYEVTSVDITQLGLIFTVAGVGVFVQKETFVDKGTLLSGYITDGIPDDKIGMLLEVKPSTFFEGSFSASVAVDDSDPYQLLTALAPHGKKVWNLPRLKGELLETNLQLFPANSGADAPVLLRSTLKCLPAVTSGTMISVVIDLFDTVKNRFGEDHAVDVYGEWNYLLNLYRTQTPVVYAEGSLYHEIVTVDSLDRLPERLRKPERGGGFECVVVVYLKTISG